MTSRSRIAPPRRGAALIDKLVTECAAIHVVLRVCDVIDDDSHRRGKSDLKRIVLMLTRLIQRTEAVSKAKIEYEYEYRNAEYEYEENRTPKQ